jgi:hypothetical protein
MYAFLVHAEHSLSRDTAGLGQFAPKRVSVQRPSRWRSTTLDFVNCVFVMRFQQSLVSLQPPERCQVSAWAKP